MTSKLVVNTIEADTGISSVSFASSISMDSTSKFHFSAAGVDIGADTNINRPAAGVLGFNVNGAEKVRIDTNGHLNTSGIVTAANFKSGVTNVHNLGLTLTGGQLDVGSNIKVGNAGVITATSFVGSGANLTNLNGSNIASGTVPVARIGTGTKSSSTFYRGDGTFAAVTSTTINSNSAQRVITGSGTANTLEAATEFLHDAANSDTKIEGYQALKVIDLIVKNTNNFGNAAGARITIESGSAANTGPQFQMICGSHSWSMQVPKAAGNLEFNNNGSLAFRMNNDNNFLVNDGNLVIGTAGHGIDFSANSDLGGQTDHEVLDDYEEGYWTPTIGGSSGDGSTSYGNQKGSYVKIGSLVYCSFYLTWSSTSASGSVFMRGIPYQQISTYGTNYNICTGSLMFDSVTTSYQNGQMTVYQPHAATYLMFYSSYYTGGWIGESHNSNWTNGGALIGSISYRAA